MVPTGASEKPLPLTEAATGFQTTLAADPVGSTALCPLRQDVNSVGVK